MPFARLWCALRRAISLLSALILNYYVAMYVSTPMNKINKNVVYVNFPIRLGAFTKKLGPFFFMLIYSLTIFECLSREIVYNKRLY